MRVDRRWLAALVLSLLLHALLVSSAGWELPFLDGPDAGMPLEARLAEKPAERIAPLAVPAPPEAPKPRRRRTVDAPSVPRPDEPVPEPIPAPAAAPEAAATAPAPAAAPPPEAAAVQAEIAWPRQGRIRFEVTRGEGEQTTLVGESIHTWRHDGETYSVRTQTETIGLAALFRPARVVQLSEGRLGAAGIVPAEFRVERRDKAAERARFDWENMKVTLYSGDRIRREAALAAGAQDMLSQIYQMGLSGGAGRVELLIATGKNVGRHAYEPAGEEPLATRFGELRTWHLKTPGQPGEQAMELWLARDYRNLPVRIRFIDRKGEVFDQHAVELEADGARLAAQE
jgi:hypothetical protein